MPDDSRDGRDAPPVTPAVEKFEASFGVGPDAPAYAPASTAVPPPIPPPRSIPPATPPEPAPLVIVDFKIESADSGPATATPPTMPPRASPPPLPPMPDPSTAAPGIAYTPAPMHTPAAHAAAPPIPPAIPDPIARVATPADPMDLASIPPTIRAPEAEPFEIVTEPIPEPADTTEIVTPLPPPIVPTSPPEPAAKKGLTRGQKNAMLVMGMLAATFFGVAGAQYAVKQYRSRQAPSAAAKPSKLEKIASSSQAAKAPAMTATPTKSVAVVYTTKALDGGVKDLGAAVAKAYVPRETTKVPGQYSTSHEKAEYEAKQKRQGTYSAKPATKAPTPAPAKPTYAAPQPAERDITPSKYAHKRKKAGKKTKYTLLERAAKPKKTRPTYSDRAYFSRARQSRYETEYSPRAQRQDYDDSRMPLVPAYDARSRQRPKVW